MPDITMTENTNNEVLLRLTRADLKGSGLDSLRNQLTKLYMKEAHFSLAKCCANCTMYKKQDCEFIPETKSNWVCDDFQYESTLKGEKL